MVDYKEKSKQARLKVLDIIYKAQSSHIGSNFSVIDILTVLFDKIDLVNDKVILSAGWKAASFYYFLKDKGVDIDLDSYCQEGSKLIGLTEPGVPGVLFAGGSMQMGLPASVGFALSKKMKGEKGKVYCIMSDGELAGGMIWESLLIANAHHLDNLFVIIDNNGFQAMGKVDNILPIWTLQRKLSSFHFISTEINGHDFEVLDRLFNIDVGGPTCIIAHTIKGKGVSFMENDNRWHYLNIDKESYEKAKQELNG